MNRYARLFLVALLWVAGTSAMFRLVKAIAENGDIAGGVGSAIAGIGFLWGSVVILRKGTPKTKTSDDSRSVAPTDSSELGSNKHDESA